MKKVDELIEVLAEHISYAIASGEKYEHEISEKTAALAELISARAKFPSTVLKSTGELAESVSTRLLNIREDQQNIKLSSSEIFRGKQTP